MPDGGRVGLALECGRRELVVSVTDSGPGVAPGDEERLGDAIALEGVAKYPVRVKCALLGWMAAKDAIQTYNANPNGWG